MPSTCQQSVAGCCRLILRCACCRCRIQGSRHLLVAAWRLGKMVMRASFSPSGTSSLGYGRPLGPALGRELRAACSRDRAAYLSDCAQQVETGRDRKPPWQSNPLLRTCDVLPCLDLIMKALDRNELRLLDLFAGSGRARCKCCWRQSTSWCACACAEVARDTSKMR